MGFLDKMKDAAEKSMDAAKKVQATRQDNLEKKRSDDREMGILLQLKSAEGLVTLFDDRLEIKNLLGSKNRTIPYSQIHAVNLDKTSGLAKGAAAMATFGASLLATNKKRLVINAGVETVSMDFRVESIDKIKKAMSIINEGIRGNSQANITVNVPSAGATSSVSNADEITKLAKLHKDGVLTDAEFDAKKKQLLGL